MHSPEDEAAARASAPLHALIAVETIDVQSPQPGQSLLRTRVARIMRDDGACALGVDTLIEVAIDSCHRGQRSPPGDDVRLVIEDLHRGSVLEAWLQEIAQNGASRRFVVVGRQIALRP